MKNILDNIIQEQTMADDQTAAINAATKLFLDKKGIKGLNLTEQIKIYQKSIGCEPTGHMLDCANKIPLKDKQMWQSLIDQNKPLGDKIFDWLHRMIGIVPGSGY